MNINDINISNIYLPTHPIVLCIFWMGLPQFLAQKPQRVKIKLGLGTNSLSVVLICSFCFLSLFSPFVYETRSKTSWPDHAPIGHDIPTQVCWQIGLCLLHTNQDSPSLPPSAAFPLSPQPCLSPKMAVATAGAASLRLHYCPIVSTTFGVNSITLRILLPSFEKSNHDRTKRRSQNHRYIGQKLCGVVVRMCRTRVNSTTLDQIFPQRRKFSSWSWTTPCLSAKPSS